MATTYNNTKLTDMESKSNQINYDLVKTGVYKFAVKSTTPTSAYDVVNGPSDLNGRDFLITDVFVVINGAEAISIGIVDGASDNPGNIVGKLLKTVCVANVGVSMHYNTPVLMKASQYCRAVGSGGTEMEVLLVGKVV